MGEPHAGARAPLDIRLLSANEVRLAAAVVAGKTNAEIATAFALTEPSVQRAIGEVCRKLGVSSRTELAVLLGALAEAGRSASDGIAPPDLHAPPSTEPTPSGGDE